MNPGLGSSSGEGIGYPLQYSWASLMAQTVENPTCNAENLGSIPGLGRFPGEGNGYALQCSGLENPHGQSSLVGYSPWGLKELDITERLSTHEMYETLCWTLGHVLCPEGVHGAKRYNN